MNINRFFLQTCAALLDFTAVFLSSSAKNAKPVSALVSIRCAEYFLFGRRTGILANISDKASLLQTMLFGAAWWLPKNDETHRIKEAAVPREKFADKGSGIRFATE